ncbi:MAG TPA: STAS domain-containing protein [Solirubrobacteraceae bacterium]|nr:STAS domain-containing protein [Solirubrobacteraceae bacterium]
MRPCAAEALAAPAPPSPVSDTSPVAMRRVPVAGELDLASAVPMLDAVRAALRSRPQTLELDLSAVTFIDVAGLRAVITCRRMAVAHDARLVLVDPSHAVRRLVEMVGLGALFGVEAGEPADAALADRARRLAAGD